MHAVIDGTQTIDDALTSFFDTFDRDNWRVRLVGNNASTNVYAKNMARELEYSLPGDSDLELALLFYPVSQETNNIIDEPAIYLELHPFYSAGIVLDCSTFTFKNHNGIHYATVEPSSRQEPRKDLPEPIKIVPKKYILPSVSSQPFPTNTFLYKDFIHWIKERNCIWQAVGEAKSNEERSKYYSSYILHNIAFQTTLLRLFGAEDPHALEPPKKRSLPPSDRAPKFKLREIFDGYKLRGYAPLPEKLGQFLIAGEKTLDAYICRLSQGRLSFAEFSVSAMFSVSYGLEFFVKGLAPYELCAWGAFSTLLADGVYRTFRHSPLGLGPRTGIIGSIRDHYNK